MISWRALWWQAFCQWRWHRALDAASRALDAADRWRRRGTQCNRSVCHKHETVDPPCCSKRVQTYDVSRRMAEKKRTSFQPRPDM